MMMYHLAAVCVNHMPQGKATILAVVGGKLQSVLQYGRRFGHTLVLGADVLAELNGATPGGPPDGVVLLPLADVATVRSLLASAPEELRLALSKYPGVSLTGGLGQLVAVGWLGSQHTLESRDFNRWLNEGLPDHLLRLQQGRLSLVSIILAHSSAGGTGNGGGMLIADRIASPFRERGIRTDIQTHLTGSLSYVELGPRVHNNSAASALAWLDFVASSDCPPTEKPPMGRKSIFPRHRRFLAIRAILRTSFGSAFGSSGPLTICWLLRVS